MEQQSDEGEFGEARAATGSPHYCLLYSVSCSLRHAVGNLLVTEEVFAGFFLD